MEFKVTFSMDKKTIDCIDRLAGALAGIKNPHEKTEPVPDTPVVETPVEPIPDTKVPEETAPQPETAARIYTKDELSKAAAEFARLGADKREELQKLVNGKYGVTGLMGIPEERYGEFAADLRELGANI